MLRMRGLGPARASPDRPRPFPAILCGGGKIQISAVEATKWRHFAEKCPANDTKWAGRAEVP